ncbi:MAG TPA: ScbR family autoregulator-binding transcription factor [Actinomycetota bacterium]|nr:ScbR family autoregulator-binding transcription factor [Actinomycetota bacterium]
MISPNNSAAGGDAPAQKAAREPRPRSKRAEITKERIVQAAAKAFAERGYLGVNLNEVVTQLGLTKGALYYFFPTKPALAVEIVGRHFGRWEPLATGVIAAHDHVLDGIIEVTYRVARIYQTDNIARAGTRLSTERMLIDAELPEPFVGWVERLANLIEKGQGTRQIRSDVNPAAIAQLIVAFFYGAQAVSEHFTERADLIERLDQFWAVIGPYLRSIP